MTEGNNVLAPNSVLYEKVLPYLVELLKSAPKYGYCGIEISFHDGRLVKIEKRCGVTLKTEPSQDPYERERG
jgi:hypothetical protein